MARPLHRYTRLHFTCSQRTEARQALRRLRAQYGDVGPENPEVVIALGGDGFMLETLHAFMGRDIPIYGMNFGTIGFLMNDYAEDGLRDRLGRAEAEVIHPLHMSGRDVRSRPFQSLAINDVALLRETRQTAKIRILVDGRERLSELIADGVLVCTPAGSTAYNLSAHGPILPFNARLMALTPISAFRPRRWRGALLSHDRRVRLEVIEPDRRPVSATADNKEFRDVAFVEIEEAANLTMTMLFDEGRAMEERILDEQFTS